MVFEKSKSCVSDKKILLSGVFGPYAQDDEFGSRRVNPMELYHNQVTRVQGPFSLRMFHRSLGLQMIAANIDAPCTILDFPTLDRFISEIKTQTYDIIGISSIIPNIGKVEKMCLEIRKYQPDAKIVVGGHITNLNHLEKRIDADYLCKGDGIRWFRKFLGQNEDAPILHPAAESGFGGRILGLSMKGKTAGVLIPSVGCPVGCNFCSTSTLFGGKGKSVNFYETGDELFSVLCQLEKKLKVSSFFVMDENFLLYKTRALRLLELMQQNKKSWAFYIFSSARVLESYTMEQLVEIGVEWVWLGLEGKDSKYSKLAGVDTKGLVKKFQEHGIRVLGSTIIGMEEHTPENMDDAIQYAIDHETDFHQFMLYTPMPGTPLYREHSEHNTLLTEEECPLPDAHGQERFNYRHGHIKDGQEKTFLLHAFDRDFIRNGPSLYRLIRTSMLGWKRYQNHPDKRIARRLKNAAGGFSTIYPAAVWAMAMWYQDDSRMHAKIKELLEDFYEEFGLLARTAAPILGRYVLRCMKKEAEKLERNWAYEPPSIYEKNALAAQLEKRRFLWPFASKTKMMHPVYDASQVTNDYRVRMDEIWQRIQSIKDAGLQQIERFSIQFNSRSEEAQAQFKQFKENLSDASGQVGDQMMRYYERFLAQCEQDRRELTRIQHQISASSEAIGEEFHQLRVNMTAKYKNVQKQIDLMSDRVYKQYKQTQDQLEQAIEQAREQVALMKRQLQKQEGL